MANNDSTTAEGAPAEGAEYEYSRRLWQALQKARQKKKKGGISGTVDEVQDIIEKIKKIQRIVDAIKVGSFTLTSCGEVFVSLWVFLIVAHVEWFVSSFIWPIYEIPFWKKMLVVMADCIILVILLTGTTFITLISQAITDPLEFFKQYWGAALEILWHLIRS